MLKLAFSSFLVLLALGNAIIVQAATLKVGTEVPVRLTHNINANLDSAGDTIYMTVTEDVLADGEVVIRKNALVKGRIEQAVGRKSMGRGGELVFHARSVASVDGQSVRLERDNINVEGRARTGATVAHVVLWGPLGLFAKGRAAFALMNTEYDLVVASDVNVDTSAASEQAESEFEDASARFTNVSRSINFRKGKRGKDYVVEFNVQGADGFSARDIRLVESHGEIVAKTVHPRSIEQASGGKLLATFDWWDIVSHALPESWPLTFELANGDAAYRATAEFAAKWKMK